MSAEKARGKQRVGRPRGEEKMHLTLRLNQQLLMRQVEEEQGRTGERLGTLVGRLLREQLATIKRPEEYRFAEDFFVLDVDVQHTRKGELKPEKNAGKPISVYLTKAQIEKLETMRRANAKKREEYSLTIQSTIASLLWDRYR